jgi:hypothetical protein
MTAKTTLNVPKLPGWITLSEAGKILKITRWAVHKMCDREDLKPGETPELNAFYIGDPTRPVYLVREAEVMALKRDRDRPAQPSASSAEAVPEVQTA